MPTNILCPNCNKVASESYKKGFSDAMGLLREQLQLCQSIRPIEIKLPKNSVIIEPKIQSAKAKQQTKVSIFEHFDTWAAFDERTVVQKNCVSMFLSWLKNTNRL